MEIRFDLLAVEKWTLSQFPLAEDAWSCYKEFLIEHRSRPWAPAVSVYLSKSEQNGATRGILGYFTSAKLASAESWTGSCKPASVAWQSVAELAAWEALHEGLQDEIDQARERQRYARSLCRNTAGEPALSSPACDRQLPGLSILPSRLPNLDALKASVHLSDQLESCSGSAPIEIERVEVTSNDVRGAPSRSLLAAHLAALQCHEQLLLRFDQVQSTGREPTTAESPSHRHCQPSAPLSLPASIEDVKASRGTRSGFLCSWAWSNVRRGATSLAGLTAAVTQERIIHLKASIAGQRQALAKQALQAADALERSSSSSSIGLPDEHDQAAAERNLEQVLELQAEAKATAVAARQCLERLMSAAAGGVVKVKIDVSGMDLDG